MTMNPDIMREHLHAFAPALADEINDHLLRPGRIASAQEVYLRFGVAEIADSAYEYFRSIAGADTWENRRNLAIFAPIGWTWVAMAIAGRFFQATVEQRPAKDAVSFISEWERGFGFAIIDIPVFTFSNVAIVSAVLIAIIVVLTLLLRRAEGHARQNYQLFIAAYGSTLRKLAAAAEAHRSTLAAQMLSDQAERRQTEAARWQWVEDLVRRGPEQVEQGLWRVREVLDAIAVTLHQERTNIEATAAARAVQLEEMRVFAEHLQVSSQALAVAETGIRLVYDDHVATSQALALQFDILNQRLKSAGDTAASTALEFARTAGSFSATATDLRNTVMEVQVFLQGFTVVTDRLEATTAHTMSVASLLEQMLTAINGRGDSLEQSEWAFMSLLERLLPQIHTALEENLKQLSLLEEQRQRITEQITATTAVLRGEYQSAMKVIAVDFTRWIAQIAQLGAPLVGHLEHIAANVDGLRAAAVANGLVVNAPAVVEGIATLQEDNQRLLSAMTALRTTSATGDLVKVLERMEPIVAAIPRSVSEVSRTVRQIEQVTAAGELSVKAPVVADSLTAVQTSLDRLLTSVNALRLTSSTSELTRDIAGVRHTVSTLPETIEKLLQVVERGEQQLLHRPPAGDIAAVALPPVTTLNGDGV